MEPTLTNKDNLSNGVNDTEFDVLLKDVIKLQKSGYEIGSVIEKDGLTNTLKKDSNLKMQIELEMDKYLKLGKGITNKDILKDEKAKALGDLYGILYPPTKIDISHINDMGKLMYSMKSASRDDIKNNKISLVALISKLNFSANFMSWTDNLSYKIDKNITLLPHEKKTIYLLKLANIYGFADNNITPDIENKTTEQFTDSSINFKIYGNKVKKKDIAYAINSKSPDVRNTIISLLGPNGNNVKDLQRFLGATDDGQFGSGTYNALLEKESTS